MNREYYPIYKMSNLFLNSVAILSPEDIEILLTSKKHLQKSNIYNMMEAWLGTGLLTSKGSKWQYRRRLLTPAFHFGILQEFSKTIIEQSEILVERLKKNCHKPYIIIDSLITSFTLHTICETAMGTRLNEADEAAKTYVSTIYDMGQLILERIRYPFLTIQWLYRFSALSRKEKSLIKTLHDFTSTVISNRKKNFIDNNKVTMGQLFESKQRMALLDLLLSLKNDCAAIDDEGIREEVDTFMFEGHDTTASGILFALLLLANHPHVQEKILEEISEVVDDPHRSFTFSDLQKLHYLEMVIKECLRLCPSVPIIARKLENELTTASGYTIPSNTIVHIHIYGLHHNSNIYPEPEKFDPERFSNDNSLGRHPFAYIPFSAGPRNCIGQRFAMLELKSALASIVSRFKLLPIDKLADVQFIAHLVLKRTATTKIQFKLR
ncbi:hypothetical protein FQA39_LY02200 [Lamprigera yunnana]|nr:hypothetical protein FQA39_LY02200 [Lamprigera yunnana]